MSALSGAYVAELHSLVVHKFLGVSVATCFVYDFATTIADEIEYVWTSKIGLADVLFVAVRYSAFPEICLYMLFYFGGLSDQACAAVAGYLSFSFAIGMVLSHGIVALRTWALWNGSRAIQVACVVGGAAFLAVLVYLNVSWIRKTHFPAVPPLNTCMVASPYRPVAASWVLLAFADAALLILTIIQGRNHLRRDSPPLVILLYQEAFVFFSLTLCCSLATLLVGMIATERYQTLLIGVERIFNAILACRIVVHLRATARAQQLPIEGGETALVFARPASTDAESGIAGTSCMGTMFSHTCLTRQC